jgi:hypothetical protein
MQMGTTNKRGGSHVSTFFTIILTASCLSTSSNAIATNFIRIPSIDYSDHWNESQWWEPPGIPNQDDEAIISCCGISSGCAKVRILKEVSIDSLNLIRSSTQFSQRINPENINYPRDCSGDPPRFRDRPILTVGESYLSNLRALSGKPLIIQGGLLTIMRSNSNAINNKPDLYASRLELKTTETSSQVFSGELKMSGGVAAILRNRGEWNRNGVIDVDPKSKVSGHGKIIFNGGTGSVLDLRGSLEPSCGELLLHVNDNGTLDLDGSNENGSINIDKYDCGYNNNLPSHLVINSSLSDPFNGRLTIGTYSSAYFSQPWINSGEIILKPDSQTTATLEGGKITLKGESSKLIVESGTARIEPPVEFREYINVSIASDARLELNGPTTYRGGNYIGEGRLVQNGDATVAKDTTIKLRSYDWDGRGLSQTTIMPGATFSIISESLAGPTPPDPNRWPTNLHRGTININGGVLRIETDDPNLYLIGAMNLAPGDSQITPRVESKHLHIGGEPGWSGPPNYSARLNLKGNADIKGDLSIGEGIVKFDFRGIDRGKMSVGGDYNQHEKSALKIRLAGIEEGHYDKIKVTGTATVAGKLDVRIDEGFDINIGDKFTILTARTVEGTMTVKPEWVKTGDGRLARLAVIQQPNELVLVVEEMK